MHQPGHTPNFGESLIDQGYEFNVQERADRAILKLNIESVQGISSILRLEYEVECLDWPQELS